MTYENTMQLYESIESISEQMLAAAKNEDWDTLIALEKVSAQHVQQLQYQDTLALSADFLAQKKARIQRILANDSQIRDLVSPQMASLSALIKNAQNGKKLSNKYSE